MIDRLLEKLGLKETEVKTFLMLHDFGPCTPTELAKISGMKRPTVYLHMEKLMQTGLAEKETKEGKTVFHAVSGEKVKILFARKKEEFAACEKEMHGLLPVLAGREALQLLKAKFRVFEGREGLESALEDLLTYKDIKTYTLWSVSSAMQATSDDFFRYHNQMRIRNNIWVDAIWPDSEREYAERYPFMGAGSELCRDLRIAPDEIKTNMGFWLYDNKALCISSQQESFGFIIESYDFVQMLKTQHQFIWQQAKSLASMPERYRSFLDEC